MTEVTSFDFSFQCPFTALISGNTGCGKTRWTQTLLEKKPFSHPAGKVYFFYRIYQPAYDEIEAEFIEGLPTTAWVNETLGDLPSGPNDPVPTIVLDDQQSGLSPDVADLFTVSSHHANCNVICIVHSLFGSPVQRLMSLNSKYLIVFKNVRDQSEIGHLAKQMDPGRNKRFITIFRAATQEPHSYLLIDLAQATPDKFRLRSNVFMENDNPVVVYERM